jgi:HEXXH motif-containing protein
LSERQKVVGPEPWLLRFADLVPLPETTNDRRLSSVLCEADPTLADALRLRGIECACGEDMHVAVNVLDRAEELLNTVPSLSFVVQSCIHEIILLHAQDDAFDVSHSEPRWPNRIFVSVPRPSPVQNFRLAEAIVHEAMHLNLSAFERLIPLVVDRHFLKSPWRSEPRPAAGVLHGIYVFCCVYRFFGHLQARLPLGESARQHAVYRQIEIASQLKSIDYCSLRTSLSSAGTSLLDDLLKMTNSNLNA